MAHCGSSTPLTGPDGLLVAVHCWLALMVHCGSSTPLAGPVGHCGSSTPLAGPDGSLW